MSQKVSKKKIMGIAFLLIAILLLMLGRKLIETNNQGHYLVKQAFISGKMTARMTPGTYGQWLGDIHTYRAVSTIGFGTQKGEGAADISAIPVIFSDGSKATISGLVRIKLPYTEEGMIALKKEYARGYEHFIRSGVVPVIQNAVKLSANLRSAQDAYTTLALFQQAIDDQLENGVYLTRSDKIIVTNSAGDTEERQVTVILTDEDGNYLRKANRIQELGCEVLECVIDVPNFDPKVEEMIALRKDEAMKTELAKQAALRAKQDAITAEQQGLANVATAKYEKEVEKVKEVTDASKKFEVEQYAAKTALETAKKIEAEGRAKAAANRALVQAGLTPQQEMERDIKIADVVSKNIANAPTPSVVIGAGAGGGTGSGGTGTVMDVFGAERALELVKKFGIDPAKTNKKKN